MIEVEDLIDPLTCDICMAYFQKYEAMDEMYFHAPNGTWNVSVDRFATQKYSGDTHVHAYDDEAKRIKPNPVFKALTKAIVKANNLFEQEFEVLVPNQMEIVKWPDGSEHRGHTDFQYHKMTAIIYLNDDYEGGETLVGDAVIKPKKGKAVFFRGDKEWHGVKKVKGTRYTIALWYTGVER